MSHLKSQFLIKVSRVLSDFIHYQLYNGSIFCLCLIDCVFQHRGFNSKISFTLRGTDIFYCSPHTPSV